ncbi:helix-hairpin-helix domain-containing protein [Companilactobacillus huachuanensis]|uniref:Helix-hairpin-helix domain-containing protein n=1 Tax=Companilactobacillus huachuanensis TaxID=2559914 RepID=A0ABW1RMB4_9LACO|nr:helix-hairpin-helix domain-containing protein [Companilactobacillus huachuanensis]
MENILNYLKRNKMLVLLGVVIIALGTGYLVLQGHKTSMVKNDLKTETKVSASKKEEKNPKVTKNKIVVVDIQGAVKTPGVYRLQNGAIVQDALKMAGGAGSNADVKQLNQAKKLTDQMQIYVPVVGEKGASAAKNGGENNSGDKKVVNINTATVDDFKGVSGIGPKKAEKIIAFREKNGEFKQLHDLTKVSGIGDKSLDSLKDQLTV